MKQPLFNYLLIFIILILLVVSVFLGVKVYNYKPVIITNESNDSIVYVHDSVDRIKMVYVSTPKSDTVHDSIVINQKSDTAEILADFNKVREYTLPIRFEFDTVNKFDVHTTVYQNHIQSFYYNSYLKPLERIIYRDKVVTPTLSTKWFVGAEIGGNLNKFDIAPKVSVLNEKNQLYSVKYNLLQPEIWVSGSWMLPF